jgi:hypothetical protein
VSWITRLMAHFGLARQLPTSEDRRERKIGQTIRKADRVLEDYRRQDLRIVVKKR